MNPQSDNAQSLDLAVALAQKAKGGDEFAFDKLVDMFWGDIYRMVYYRTQSDMDAEDIAQEAFIKAFDGLAQLRDVSCFKAWLYSIAVNLVRDHHRRQSARRLLRPLEEHDEQTPAPTGRAGGPALEDQVAAKELWRMIAVFCQRLPGGEREAFTLHFLDGLGIKEVAQALGKSESAVKTQLYRAVAKLRGKAELLKALRGEA